jgi:hypothetical protein
MKFYFFDYSTKGQNERYTLLLEVMHNIIPMQRPDAIVYDDDRLLFDLWRLAYILKQQLLLLLDKTTTKLKRNSSTSPLLFNRRFSFIFRISLFDFPIVTIYI